MKQWTTLTVAGAAGVMAIPFVWCQPPGGGLTAQAAHELAGSTGLSCPADVIVDGLVDGRDLVAVLRLWGPCAPCPEDITGDGVVDADDLVRVVLSFGPCRLADDLPLEGDPPPGACGLEDETFITADGGCKDLATGLVWSSRQMGHAGGLAYPTAEQWVADSTEAGFDDWRLPTKEEVEEVAANGAGTHFNAGFSCGQPGFHPVWSSRAGRRWAWITSPCTGDSLRVLVTSSGGFVGVRAGDAPPSGECNDNGVCDPGEDCETCSDCEGVTNGKPANRYCCGNGVPEGPEGDGSICDGNY